MNRNKKTGLMVLFFYGGDDGTRTHDLLRDKQTL